VAEQKILIVGPSWVGDLVMMHALCRELLRERGQTVIDVLAPAWSVSLLSRMPGVRRAIPLAAGHGQLGLGERMAIGRSLRDEAYTQAIVIPRAFKAALVPWFARIPRRTGFAAELRLGLLNDRRVLDRTRLDQTVKRLLALGLPPDAPLPEAILQPQLNTDPANTARLQQRWPWLAAPALVALLPGAAYGPAKQWPLGHFQELAAALVHRGSEVVVLGSGAERALGDAIVRAAPAHVHNLCGETGLDDVVDLLGLARVAVSNDSGLLHVAAAVGTHVLGIYGSSSPAFTPPLTGNATICYLALSCSPCFARECPLGHLRCLTELSPAAVLAALAPLLPAQRAAGPNT